MYSTKVDPVPPAIATGSDKDLGLLAESTFRPRVLFVSSSKANGGADRHAITLAAGMRSRGARIMFACRNGKFTALQCADRQIPTTSFNIANSGDVAAVVRLAGQIQRHRIDIVHAHARRDFVTVALAVALARSVQRGLGLPESKLVLHVHLIRTLGQPDRAAGRFFEANADAVVAVSDSVANLLNQRHDLSPGFVRRVFNGIDLDAYPMAGSPAAFARRAAKREQWGVPPDAPVIGMVGRLYQKGQVDMLRAAPELVRRFPDLRIVLVGPPKLEGDEGRFRELAGHFGVARNVVVGGVEEDVPAAMAAFDVLAHLPTDEAFGLVLVEAMAAGVPVVATSVGGCREVVRHGENGLLVAPQEHDELVAALDSLLEPTGGSALRQLLAVAGRRTAAGYSLQVQLDQLESIYRAVLSRSAAKA